MSDPGDETTPGPAGRALSGSRATALGVVVGVLTVVVLLVGVAIVAGPDAADDPTPVARRASTSMTARPTVTTTTSKSTR